MPIVRYRLLIAGALILVLLLLAVRPVASREEQRLLRVARGAVEAEVLGKAAPRIEGRSPPRPVFVTIERALVVRRSPVLNA